MLTCSVADATHHPPIAAASVFSAVPSAAAAFVAASVAAAVVAAQSSCSSAHMRLSTSFGSRGHKAQTLVCGYGPPARVGWLREPVQRILQTFTQFDELVTAYRFQHALPPEVLNTLGTTLHQSLARGRCGRDGR